VCNAIELNSVADFWQISLRLPLDHADPLSPTTVRSTATRRVAATGLLARTLGAMIDIQPVGTAQLDSVRRVFNSARQTRHCWCMAFCSTSRQFATGWYGGGNKRRFAAMAVSEHDPMGVLAVQNCEPIGWCACGPRTRYRAALDGRSGLLSERPRDEDHRVWLVACAVIRPDYRQGGVVLPLLRGAVSLARERGASAVEAWPLAAGIRRVADDHVGREAVFARLGFTCIQRPTPTRAIMRLELDTAA
jgi:hypothetical protein